MENGFSTALKTSSFWRSEVKKPFKVGDKIKFVDACIPTPTLAIITSIEGLGDSCIHADIVGASEWITVHPRQITHRIIKKPKRPRVTREQLAGWFNAYNLEYTGDFSAVNIARQFRKLCALVLGEGK
jgi:hypothetical protein